jgi:MinD-like ATPase involved in chromosome partitioning or flagellar assembly
VNRQTESLRRFLGGAQPTVPPSDLRLIAVGAGKGGTGASLVAGLVAVGAASYGLRTLLIDTDADIGTMHRLFGLQDAPSFVQMRHASLESASLITPIAEHLDGIAGGGAEQPLTDLELRTLLRRVAERFAEYDLIVLDAGSRVDAVLRAASLGPAHLLAVTTPEPVAAAATYALIKSVDARASGTVAHLVLNRADSSGARRFADEISTASQRWLGHPVPTAAELPDDPSLRAALTAGLPLPDAAAGSPVAALLATLASRLLFIDPTTGRPAVRSA